MGVATHLFAQQTVHEEYQRPLQAVEDGEDVRCSHVALFKEEGAKHPHESQDAHLSDGCHCERSVRGGEDMNMIHMMKKKMVENMRGDDVIVSHTNNEKRFKIQNIN